MVVPTLVGFGNYQPPLTPKLPPICLVLNNTNFNTGDTGAILTTSQIFWGEPCIGYRYVYMCNVIRIPIMISAN